MKRVDVIRVVAMVGRISLREAQEIVDTQFPTKHFTCEASNVEYNATLTFVTGDSYTVNAQEVL